MSKGGGGAARAVATIGFIVIVAAAIIVPISRSRDATSMQSAPAPTPKAWDARVAPLAAIAARLRGLDFKRPVPVKFLPAAEFEKEIGGDGTSTKEDKAEATRSTATLRAIGLIGPNVDLAKAVNDTTQSSVLALYSDRRKEILVRGSTIDVSHKVTLVHELTHALQDQHFDLTKLGERADKSKTGDFGAYKALVEGDATRIEDKYRESLPKADQDAYANQHAAEGQRVQTATKDVPPIITFLFDAPYLVGPATINLLDETGGRAAVDAAISGPTPGTLMQLQSGNVKPDTDVSAPKPPAGGKVVGDSELFDAFPVYLMLAAKLDAVRALEAAETITGGRAITFERGKTVCYRAKLEARSDAATRFLHQALVDWARQLPTVQVDSDGLAFTACDPGARAKSPTPASVGALSALVEARSQFTQAAFEGQHGSLEQARCASRVLMQQPGVLDTIVAVGNDRPNAAQIDKVGAAQQVSLSVCARNLDAGLP